MKDSRTLTEWCIIHSKKINRFTIQTINIADYFSDLDGSHDVALFGRAKDDQRYDITTDNFATGHRLVTSVLRSIDENFWNYLTAENPPELRFSTKNSEYILKMEEMDVNYKIFLLANLENRKGETHEN
ncbi:MAG: hypothetical protein FWG64_05650 [Firmicutes bacterium]|nr:hypothetical protein [Bacillota bacterium]